MRTLITFVLPCPCGLFLVDTFVFIGIYGHYNSITCLLWSRLKIKKCGRKENTSHGSLPRLSHCVVFFPFLRSLVITTAAVSERLPLGRCWLKPVIRTALRWFLGPVLHGEPGGQTEESLDQDRVAWKGHRRHVSPFLWLFPFHQTVFTFLHLAFLTQCS